MMAFSQCPGCGRHCSPDALHCGRGAAWFSETHPAPWADRRFYGGGPRGQRPMGGPPGGPQGFRALPHGPGGPHGFRPPMGGPGCPGSPGGPHGRPPREDDGSLSFLLLRCVHALHRSARQGDSQQRVLRILSWRDSMSQRELQDHLRVQPGSLSELLSKLEAKGLLTRERDESDKRRVTLRLTEEGRRTVDALPEPGDRDALFAVLTPEERNALRALLEKLVNEPAE